MRPCFAVLCAVLCAVFVASEVRAQWGGLPGAVASQAQGQLFRRRAVRYQPAPAPVYVRPQPRIVEPEPCPCEGSRDQRCTCGPKCDCAAPEAAPAPVAEQVENFGVDLSKLHTGGEEYRVGERQVTRQEAYDAVAKGLPDDRGKPRVTVIGPDEARKPFEAEFRASELAQRCLLWSVPPDHWSLKDNDGAAAFKTDGAPTIYCQAPDGKVLWRQDNAAGAIEALRKVTKPYDPARDPGPNSATPAGPLNLPMPVYVLGGAIALMLLVQLLKGKAA